MFTSYRHRFLHAFTLAVAILFAQSANASFHLWQIAEIYSSADGTVQYIELTTSASGQQFVGGHQVTASQNGTTHSFTLPANLPGDSSNHKFLIGTQGFASLGVVAPDYVVPNGFLFQPNGSVDFAGVDVVTYDALPSNGVSALDRAGNIVVNAPTNFGGATDTLSLATATPVFTGGPYDGIYQWDAGYYLSVHQDGSRIIATIYGNYGSGGVNLGGLAVNVLDLFELLDGQIVGSNATISGARIFRACKVSYGLVFNSDSTLTVRLTSVSNSLGISVANINCATQFNAVGSVWTIPRIF